MADFPGGLPSFTDLIGSQTLAANNHSNRHNKVHEEVLAVATKVGTTGSADTTSHDYKIAQLRSDVDDLQVDPATTAYVDAAVAAAIITAKQQSYPIGSLYYQAAVATNPSDGSLLGFGTWVAHATGRVLVGVDSGQTEFDTLGETGGAKTHTLLTTEIPSHVHGGLHLSNDRLPALNPGAVLLGPTYGDNATTTATGGGGAHNNLQPYITVYIWRRTA